MIVSRKPLNISEFSLTLNNLNIKRSDCVKYLRVLLDERFLRWKNQVKKLNKSLSKIWGLIFKLRHYCVAPHSPAAFFLLLLAATAAVAFFCYFLFAAAVTCCFLLATVHLLLLLLMF